MTPDPLASVHPLPGEPAELAIVLVPNGAGGTHAGLVFRQNDSPTFLHLAFDCDLRAETQVPGLGLYYCPTIPSRLLNHLLMLLPKIHPQNRSTIQYAFGYDASGRFDLESGRISFAGAHFGLTCATFVLAVFGSVGFSLVDPTTWTERPGDSEVIARLIALLQERKGREYAERVARDASGVRFRPEDVMAAAIHDDPPHAMTAIAKTAKTLRARVTLLSFLFRKSDPFQKRETSRNHRTPFRLRDVTSIFLE